MVRTELLGKEERKILEAYLLGERLKNYNILLFRIRKLGLRKIVEGCESDLTLLKKATSKRRPANWLIRRVAKLSEALLSGRSQSSS